MDKTTSFAKLPPFSCADVTLLEAQNKWQVWHRGFEICLRACKITDPGEKRDMLLAQGGIELQEIFFNLPEPDVDEEDAEEVDPYKIAIDMIEAYFVPKRLEVEERYQFWSVKPESQESLSKFLERVLELASKCNFGETATECQNIAVIDKMIQFIPEPLKKKLLRESSLSIDELIKRISACDTPFATSSETSLKPAGKPCKSCGQSHGKDQKCKAWNKNCYNCGKAGHFGSMCYSPPGAMTEMKKIKRSQAFAIAKNLGPGAVMQKQPWKKNYAQINAGGSTEHKKPWKKNYSEAFSSSERISYDADEGRAMKYARRMYGVDDAELDYEKLSRGTNSSDYSYNNLW